MTRTDELVRYVATGSRPSLQLDLAHWVEANPRFAEFVATHRDKVRKKLRTAANEEARQDVLAELLVAHTVLADRRFAVAFEAYGAGQGGPDLSVTYRVNQRFNFEVTRLRGETAVDAGRLTSVIAAKVRQLPAEVANALVIVTAAVPAAEDEVTAAMRLLKTRTNARDDAFFVARGLASARDFYARYLRLSGVLVFQTGGAPVRITYVPSRDARRPLPDEALSRLLGTR